MGDQKEILRCDKSIGIRYESKRLPKLPNCTHTDKEVFKCSFLNLQDVRRIHQSLCSTTSKTDQDYLILKYAVTTTPKRNSKKLENSSRKGITIQYKVPRFRVEYGTKATRIYQRAFTSILDVSKNRIRRVCKAYLNDGTMAREKRGSDTISKTYAAATEAAKSFIKKLKPLQSHYCQNFNSSKQYLSSNGSIKKLWERGELHYNSDLGIPKGILKRGRRLQDVSLESINLNEIAPKEKKLIELYKERLPELPLPPETVLTKWCRTEAVTYSRPTYVAGRSVKHSSSIALSHAVNFNRLATLDTFKEIMRNKEGCLKPVILVSSDGGPDESLRYAKRRMAPLSRELSGLILPHDSYGTHPDKQGRTTNFDLEKKNFQKAGEVLVEVWNSIVIDHHEVVAEYVVKCDDRACCGNMQSSLRLVLPERFLPPPYPILQSSCGLYIPKLEDHDGKTFVSFLLQLPLGITPTHKSFEKMPYDLYCPSLKDERHQLVGRTCKQLQCQDFPTTRWLLRYIDKVTCCPLESSSWTLVEDDEWSAVRFRSCNLDQDAFYLKKPTSFFEDQNRKEEA
ncbi:hypothetical protein ILUMI_24679 [Ignelater luminosus]|uniref:Uncharacterized protein n=1 Tax=Ignelater luminosus TaxID=2038154 RepID=A0A8K0CA19_IGNLU|nr:hypothetical protein ILUMI_24679 [Ignelater luminosus]